MKTVIFICDHSLDPRLRRRVRWFKEYGFVVTVYVDKSRGSHFKDSCVDEIDLVNLKTSDLIKSNILYVSGAKILIKKFFFLLYAKKRLGTQNIFYEIPDLPLRSHSKVLNYFYLLAFRCVVHFLYKNIVVTSTAFINELKNKDNYYLCENLPDEDIVSLSESIVLNTPRIDNRITIGFVGALRYEMQMFYLIKYCILRKIKCVFYGGPQERIEKLVSICRENNVTLNNLIEFRGKFTPQELPMIYSEIDFVYSVYDSLQPNVRLALPNKLYEGVLFKTPIIVSDNTYLSTLVCESKIGFKVNELCFEDFKNMMDEGISNNYIFDKEREQLIEKVKSSKENFMCWVFDSM